MSSVRTDEHLEAMRDALVARKDVIVERLLARCEAAIGTLDEPTRSGLYRQRADEIDAYLEALVDPSTNALEKYANDFMGAMDALGLPPALLQTLNAITREVLLDVGIELHHEGVPRAMAGVKRLLGCARESFRIVDEALRMRAKATRETQAIFETVFDTATDSFAISTFEGKVLYANPAFHDLFGVTTIAGTTIATYVAPEDAANLLGPVRTALLERGQWSGRVMFVKSNGVVFEGELTTFLLRDDDGKPMARCAFLRDRAQAKLAEEERRRLTEELIAAQKRAIEEIGTPLVPLAEGVLAMPLIGQIDSGRAERMLDVLLEGIAHEQANVVLIDITGVRLASEEAANALVRAALAARLLGAEVVLTGIGPDAARTFVEQNANFAAITTKATLGDGVAFALRKRKAPR